MALDARVYCDCLEKGRIDGVPAEGLHVKMEPDGSSWLYKHGKLVDHDHHDYNIYSCNHKDRVLIDRRLGNIGLVSLLRFELQREPESFPILLGKVVYDGIHAGDWLSIEVVKAMQIELERLQTFHAVGTMAQAGVFEVWLKKLRLDGGHHISPEESGRFLAAFRKQMLELSEASLSTGKPVVF